MAERVDRLKLEGLRPYICTVTGCRKPFDTPEVLGTHMQEHQRVDHRPRPCSAVEKLRIQAAALRMGARRLMDAADELDRKAKGARGFA